MPIEVRDHLSNRPENIAEAAKIIGRSKLKLGVFRAIYWHKTRSKSVTEISEISGLTNMQVLQAGGQLVNSGLAQQEKTEKGTCYVQIPFFQTNKAKILNLVENPDRISKVVTKRTPSLDTRSGVTFVKKQRRKGTRRLARPKKARVRIAFLSTNPESQSLLRTDIEARNVIRAIQKTTYRDQIDLKHIPAAEWEDLLDTLNEFEPHILHFSGHGCNTGLLFDNVGVNDDGGFELNFDLIHKFIGATNNKPILLILNACNTASGAEVFLENVKAVVAMSDSIEDAAAELFSTRFYAALANGQSIDNALKQAKTVLSLLDYSDSELPTLLATTQDKDFRFF